MQPPHQSQWNTELQEEWWTLMSKKSRNPGQPAMFFRNQIPIAQERWSRGKALVSSACCFSYKVHRQTNSHLCCCISPCPKWWLLCLISLIGKTRKTKAWKAAQKIKKGQCWTSIQGDTAQQTPHEKMSRYTATGNSRIWTMIHQL